MTISPVEQYIRQRALAYGIDPNVAVKVAKGEGGLQDPFRRGQGPAPRSQAPGLGVTENSFGPLQLYVSGTGAGLGDRALAAGIDPRKDWQGGVDFALKEAANKGWGQWYGAKAQGITGKMGIGGAPAGLTLSPQAADFVQNNPQPGGFGLPVEQAAGGAMPAPFGSMSPQPDTSIDPNVAQYAFADDKDTMGNRLQNAGKAFSAAMDMKAPRPGPFPGGPSAEQSGGLLKATNSIQQLAQMLLQRRTS